jgi:branched-chain amino acid transport system substrate-binding protein
VIGRSGIVLLTTLGLIGAACGGDNSGGSSSNTTSASTAAATTGAAATTAAAAATTTAAGGATTTAASATTPIKVKIAYDGPTTGPAAGLASEITYPTQMALEDLKAMGLDIDLEQFDSQFDPARAVALYRDAIKDDPLAVMGSVSNSAAAIGPLANQASIPFIPALAAVLDVTTKNRPWVFTTSGDTQQFIGQGIKAWLTENSTITKVAAITDSKNVSTAAQGQWAMDAAGDKAAESENFETGATDFAALVARAIGQGANGIVIASTPSDTAAIAKEIRRQGSQALIFIVQGAFSQEAIKAGGDTLAGAYVVGQWFSGLTNPETIAYEKRFLEKSGGKPAVWSHMYEAWMMLGRAILSVPGIQDMSLKDAREALRAALEKVQFPPVGGGAPIQFNAQGYTDRTAVLVELKADGTMEQKKI